jgi:hypothetical protein
MTLTPYLMMVIAGFAVFVLVLGVYWLRSYVAKD